MNAPTMTFTRTCLLCTFVALVAAGVSACGSSDSSPADAALPDAASGDAAPPDGGSPDAAVACPAQTGKGTSHQGVIEADETWTAATGPHTVAFDLFVNKAR